MNSPNKQKKASKGIIEVTKGYLFHRHAEYNRWREDNSVLAEIHNTRIESFYKNNTEHLESINKAIVEIDMMTFKYTLNEKEAPVYEKDEHGNPVFNQGFDDAVHKQILSKLFAEKVTTKL